MTARPAATGRATLRPVFRPAFRAASRLHRLNADRAILAALILPADPTTPAGARNLLSLASIDESVRRAQAALAAEMDALGVAVGLWAAPHE